ncbi:hypothetical protein GCM10022221_51770 [Actinocorallia aurea]
MVRAESAEQTILAELQATYPTYNVWRAEGGEASWMATRKAPRTAEQFEAGISPTLMDDTDRGLRQQLVVEARTDEHVAAGHACHVQLVRAHLDKGRPCCGAAR